MVPESEEPAPGPLGWEEVGPNHPGREEKVMPKRYWLLKSEEDVYSIRDLERDGRTSWEGVRNYEARNLMRDEMSPGDRVLFYHSNAKPPGVAGLARIARKGYPDPFAFDEKSRYFDPGSHPDEPRWFMVDVEFVEAFPEVVSLEAIKSVQGLRGMTLLNRSRLSVQPVTREEFGMIRKLGRTM
jgi:predicted RNA-binding protein with PUA-like domain